MALVKGGCRIRQRNRQYLIPTARKPCPPATDDTMVEYDAREAGSWRKRKRRRSKACEEESVEVIQVPLPYGGRGAKLRKSFALAVLRAKLEIGSWNATLTDDAVGLGCKNESTDSASLLGLVQQQLRIVVRTSCKTFVINGGDSESLLRLCRTNIYVAIRVIPKLLFSDSRRQ
jgi:hypothetical protein